MAPPGMSSVQRVSGMAPPTRTDTRWSIRVCLQPVRGQITEIELPVIPDIDTVRNNDALMAKTESTTIHEDVPLVEDSLAMDFENERGNNLPSNTVTILEEVLPPDVAYGRILFHDANDHRISSGATVSCASCHPDGRTDNMTWKFNFGPRNTPQLGWHYGYRALSLARRREPF